MRHDLFSMIPRHPPDQFGPADLPAMGHIHYHMNNTTILLWFAIAREFSIIESIHSGSDRHISLRTSCHSIIFHRNMNGGDQHRKVFD
jgi:hypothetical protein